SSSVHVSSLSFPSLMSRPPLSPPPFPYTTLFRSVRGPPRAGLLPAPGHSRRAHERPGRGVLRLLRRVLIFQQADRRAHGPGFARDRKSTRLNSSHEWISYAVFCLKKKRKTELTDN